MKKSGEKNKLKYFLSRFFSEYQNRLFFIIYDNINIIFFNNNKRGAFYNFQKMSVKRERTDTGLVAKSGKSVKKTAKCQNVPENGGSSKPRKNKKVEVEAEVEVESSEKPPVPSLLSEGAVLPFVCESYGFFTVESVTTCSKGTLKLSIVNLGKIDQKAGEFDNASPGTTVPSGATVELGTRLGYLGHNTNPNTISVSDCVVPEPGESTVLTVMSNGGNSERWIQCGTKIFIWKRGCPVMVREGEICGGVRVHFQPFVQTYLVRQSTKLDENEGKFAISYLGREAMYPYVTRATRVKISKDHHLNNIHTSLTWTSEFDSSHVMQIVLVP